VVVQRAFTYMPVHLIVKRILRSLFCVSLLFFTSCTSAERERPYGELRLGNVNQLKADEMYLADARLLLKRDAGGWYIMSTLCTYDLSPLVPHRKPEGVYWHSQYTESKYDPNGNVLSGPSRAPLPRYKLSIDSWSPGGRKDTLYVAIGDKVSQEWRLQVPQDLIDSTARSASQN
jgi:hypothetical protein